MSGDLYLPSSIRRNCGKAHTAIEIAREEGLKPLIDASTSEIRGTAADSFLDNQNIFVDRRQLRDRASKNGSYWAVNPGNEFHYSETHEDFKFSKPVGSYSTGQDFVCALPDVSILGGEPLFFSSDNKFILECTKDNRKVLKKRLERIRYLALLSQYLAGPVKELDYVFPLVRYNYQPSYYHWWVEDLSALRRLRYYEEQTGLNPTILIEHDPPSWITESLAVLGFEEDRIHEYENEFVRCKELILPSFNHHVPEDFRPNSEDYTWLRETARSNVSESGGYHTNSRLYISRELADQRRVTNRAEIMDVLRPLGFELVKLETKSVREQVRLFANAEIIVGPHGAGFTNVLFSDDALVVEFMPKNRRLAFFRNLCQTLGHQYGVIGCDQEGRDIQVPLQKLKTLLSLKLDSRTS